MKNTLSVCFLFIFQIIHSQFTPLHVFDLENSGAASYATLISDGTYLYGTTSNGLLSNFGTVFRMLPDGSAFETIYEFTGAPDGRQPICGLYYDGVWLYGTTREDGLHSAGTVFKLKPDGSEYQILHHFNSVTDGQWPGGSVISDGTYLYGTTNRGLSGINGLVYRVKTDGTDYETLHAFDGITTGSSPHGALISDGEWLYGLTEKGGVNDDGVLFRITSDGETFEKLFDFDANTSGEWQMASLLLFDGWLYGMNQSGGANGQGTLFKIAPDGSNHTVLIDFELLSTGRAGTSTPVTDGTYLYAMTQYGGEFDDGAIFRIKPDGTDFLKMFDFQDYETGMYPTAGLLLHDNLLYGVTNLGGENYDGLVFEFQPPSANTLVSIEAENFVSYPNPATDRLSFKGINSKAQISIADLTGKICMRGVVVQNQFLDVSALEPGLYFVMVEENNFRRSGMVIIE